MPRFSFFAALFLAGTVCFTEAVFMGPADAAGNPSAGRAAEKERRVERVKRFLQRTLDDLRDERKLVEEDIAEIENQVDAITPLESSQREVDFQNLTDWYNGYLDWLNEQTEELDDDLAQLSVATLPGSEYWDYHFAEMIKTEKELEKELQDKVVLFSAEEKRLAGILDQRRLLQGRLNDLEDRRKRIEQKSPLSDRDKATLDRIRVDVGVVQTEFLSLPMVDEDLLKHYAVMIERGRWESDWLALRIEEYGALREVAVVIPREAFRGAGEMEAAYRRTVRMYESQTNRLNRKIDELDRKKSRVTPAGTIRQVDRSRELLGLYDRLRERYNELINRYKIRIGAYGAESADIRSAKP